MTEKLLIVILSTDTTTKEMESKAMNEKKSINILFSISQDSNLYHQGILVLYMH